MEALSRVGYGQPTATQILLTGTSGCIIQAIGVGSCLQLCYQYFAQSRRDGLYARLGIVWITSNVVIQAVICNIQNARNIRLHENYPSAFFVDWWLTQLSGVFDAFVLIPVCGFLIYRAFILWDRSRLVLIPPIVTMSLASVFSLAYLSCGLRCPWGLHDHTDAEIAEWAPEYERMFVIFYPLSLITYILLSLASATVSVLICIGVLRYRVGLAELDGAIARVVYLSTESLLPMVILSIFPIIGGIMKNSSGFLIHRITTQLFPCFYSYSLLTSLVWRERVARILQAEPVRNMAVLHAQLDEESKTASAADPTAVPLQWSFQPGTTTNTTTTPATPILQQQSTLSDPSRSGSPLPKSVLLAQKLGSPTSNSTNPWTTGPSVDFAFTEEELRRGSEVLCLEDILSKGPPPRLEGG